MIGPAPQELLSAPLDGMLMAPEVTCPPFYNTFPGTKPRSRASFFTFVWYNLLKKSAFPPFDFGVFAFSPSPVLKFPTQPLVLKAVCSYACRTRCPVLT
eukprot:240270-Rhodomonas_salina.1